MPVEAPLASNPFDTLIHILKAAGGPSETEMAVLREVSAVADTELSLRFLLQ